MDDEVFYFTGTGNSLFLAKHLRNNLKNITLIPVSSVDDKEIISPKTGLLGLIFPVYYNDLPNIIKRFVSKLEGIENTYIFAICNYGGAAGASLTNLQSLLHANGGELSAGFGVHMPQNAFRKPWENYVTIYKKSKMRIDDIVHIINARKKGLFYSNKLLQGLLYPFHSNLKKATIKHLKQIVDEPVSSDYSLEELIALTDKTFVANNDCNGCGICERICPVKNIQIVDKRPVWQHRCENCIACYNWCPQQAIDVGIIKKGYHYVNAHIHRNELTRP